MIFRQHEECTCVVHKLCFDPFEKLSNLKDLLQDLIGKCTSFSLPTHPNSTLTARTGKEVAWGEKIISGLTFVLYLFSL